MVVHTVRSIGYQVDLDAYKLQIAYIYFFPRVLLIKSLKLKTYR